ncbi:MAG: ATP-binding cassette domain-containing protein [Candidatus Omnitrophica bacterium]|nr:ATP-binding cassette domain-containing protein [Candidatus Omnitrophota bacterium]
MAYRDGLSQEKGVIYRRSHPVPADQDDAHFAEDKMRSVLEIKGLSKEYTSGIFPFRAKDPVTALDNIDLDIDSPGEVVRISGPNGSGKTTLLKCISGIILPTRGTVRVLEKDIRKNHNDVIRNIGLLTDQERSFYWRLSGRENMRFFGGLHGLDKPTTDERIRSLADRLQIEDLVDEPFSGYSTGIRQRFSIMRALLHRPRLLLLDEPLRSLDRSSSERLSSLVLELSREDGVTVIYTTHEQNPGGMPSSRHLRMDKGRVIA